MKKNKLIDRVVYLWSKKPDHYKEVRNPPKTNLEKLLRVQDARQVQYNNWSKRFKVYSGSYLPRNRKKLLKNGWKIQSVGNKDHQVIQRKSTKQTVRYDRHGGNKPHAHWLRWWKKGFTSKEYERWKKRDYSGEKMYYDEYGEPVSRRAPEHHIYFKK